MSVDRDDRFDEITAEAIDKLHVKISVVSLITSDEEVYISCQGEHRTCGPRNISFCGHALAQKDVLIVRDTLKDNRYIDNPYVAGPPFLRFYAGMRLTDHTTGQPLGVFCVKDDQPRDFNIEELGIFVSLANKAELILQK